MKQGYFITGTDTNVGKTVATIALMRYFKQQGQSVLAMKPVAAGAELQRGQLRNEDALLLQANATVDVGYDLINPYVFALPVSPHLAAGDATVSLEVIAEHFNTLKHLADIVLVEGAGGWYTPLNATQTICDLASALSLPVILVVAVKLGCLNHAQLSYQAIVQSGNCCAGWLAVHVDRQQLLPEANIATLQARLPIPLLGVLPFQDDLDFDVLAGCLAL